MVAIFAIFAIVAVAIHPVNPEYGSAIMTCQSG
jgi:hypothetical protein